LRDKCFLREAVLGSLLQNAIAAVEYRFLAKDNYTA